MPVSFVNHATNQNAAGATAGNLVVNVPASTQDGDTMLAFVYLPDGGTLTAPGGWTQVGSTLTDATLATQSRVYRRTASSEPASYTWTIGAAAIWGVAHFTFRDVNTTTPIHQNAGANTVAATATVSGPNVTTTIDTTVVTFQMTRRSDATEVTHTNGSGDTEIVEWGNDGGATTRQAVAYYSVPLAIGTIGRSVTVSSTTNFTGRQMFTIALTPVEPSDTDTGTGTEGAESISGTAVDTDTGTGTESESVSIPIANSDTGTGTEGAESLTIMTHHIASDTFNRVDETTLSTSSSGAVWTNV